MGLSWLRFGLDHRLRYESLSGDFRAKQGGSSGALFLRTLVSAELRWSALFVGGELEDASAYGSFSSPVNTTLVNPLELLQAYGGIRGESVFVPGDTASITAGRMTLDVGSRRLIARNDFRNTINGFNGVDVQWSSPDHHLLRAFFMMPVIRLPLEPGKLADNDVRFDQENTAAFVGGVFFGSAPVWHGVQLETYAIGLFERDHALAPSTNRHLVTPGIRLLRPPSPGAMDVQIEAMMQVGTTLASALPNETHVLVHRAALVQAAIGYRFDSSAKPRLALHYDYASGHRDPGDRYDGRFDTLYGARRFDFGPTGLYGVVARSNVSSPAARVEVSPLSSLDAALTYRLVWLASARDGWAGAGVRDTTDASGAFVGAQIDARVRWTIFPKNLVFELGGAVLNRGRFARDAPGAPVSDPVYFYTQLTGSI